MTDLSLAPVDPALNPALLPVEPAPVAANANVLVFAIPGTEPATQISIDLGQIPPDARLFLLGQKVREYVTNSVNQVVVRHKKVMEPFDAYAKAMQVDPLQTAIAAPTTPAPVLDVITPAAAARDRLYKGEMRKQGETRKAREKVDPLTKLVTDTVVRELFEKRKLATAGYKWTDAVKEVAGNGVEYLDQMIAEKVAAGGDAAALEAFKQARYIKPAMLMLGQSTTKATAGEGIL